MQRKEIRQHYPRGFTQLLAEVADTAMKAVVEPDATAYVHERTDLERLDLIQFRRALSAEDRMDPKRRALFRRDIARVKAVRELSLQVLDVFRRLDQAHANLSTPASALSLPGSVAQAPSPVERH